MKPNQKVKTPKLSKVVSAISLALLIPVTANAAIDPNFPTFGGDDLYLNHVNSALPGNNLIPNPSFDLCMSDIEASVYVLSGLGSDVPKAGAGGAIDCTKDITWSWQNIIKGGGTSNTEASAHYAPPNATLGTYKGLSRGGNTATLRSAITVANANTIYVQYDYQTVAQSGSQVKLTLDSGEVIVETLPDAESTWTTSNFIHTFNTPYTGNINIAFTSKVSATNSEQVRIDNVFLSTDAQFAAPAVDSDGDGFSDDEEIAVYSDENDINITPENADNDGDGYLNTEEIAAGTDHEDPFDNPGSEDTDGDGYFDAEETAEGSDLNDINKTPVDLDGDGIQNSLFSSGSIFNGSDKFPENEAVSIDDDDDGYPNAFNESCDVTCQEASGLTIDAFPAEVGAYLDMSTAQNLNGDGLADACSISLTGDAPIAPELEGSEFCGTIAMDYDNDDDGFKNQEEVNAGSNPNDAGSGLNDLDTDGWDNEDDQYPNLSMLSQNITNALLMHGYDGESNTEEWTTFGSSKEVWTADIVNVTGHDGTATNVFHLLPETADAGKNFMHKGPTLTTNDDAVVQNVRLAGWVKIDVAEGITPSKILFRLFNTHEISTAAPKGTSYPAIILNMADYYNIGWVYVESQLTFPAPALTSQIQLLMNQDAGTGIEVWFDDLELNVINNDDLDEDLAIDALDTDDDNDNIIDGSDDTPLGEFAQDSDLDGILDGYDDDRDNDLIVNAFDANFNPIIADVTSTNNDTSISLIAIANDLDLDATLSYIWNVSGIEQAENSNTLTLEHADHDAGRTLQVSVKVTDSITESALFNTTATMPGQPVNGIPNAIFSVSDVLGGDKIITATFSDADGDELTFTWALNGVDVENTATSLTLNYSDYDAGEVVEVSITVTDGEDSFTQTQSITLNSVPVVDVEETSAAMTTTLTARVNDIDNDTVTYSWLVDGNEIADANDADLTLEYYLYASSVETSITVTVLVNDGLNTTATEYTVLVPANNAPEVSIVDTITDMTSSLVVTTVNTENDPLTYKWTVNGEVQTTANGDYVNKDTLEIDYSDFQAGSTITISVDVNDGINTTTQTHDIVLPSPATTGEEQYPEGNGDGGATWWLLVLLSSCLWTRRKN